MASWQQPLYSPNNDQGSPRGALMLSMVSQCWRWSDQALMEASSWRFNASNVMSSASVAISAMPI